MPPHGAGREAAMKLTKLNYPFLLLVLLLFSGWSSDADLQAQRRRSPYPSNSRSNEETDPNDPRQKLARRILKESFEALQKESQQLVELSIELRDDLHNTTEDELNLTAMKKAEAIEKLAAKVKNRIKNL